MPDRVADLMAFIDRSPTPYHAVAEVRGRLVAAGFLELAEEELWQLAPGDRRFVVRRDSSLLAFEVGEGPPSSSGFRAIAAHTDSPNLRLKPRADSRSHGYRQLAVEPYGSALLHTWLDRDLSLAGRVTLAGPEGPERLLVDFGRPILRVPSLAIHLYRELAQEGLKLNAQQHMAPLLGLDDPSQWPEVLAQELATKAQRAVEPDAILGFDLMAYDAQPACVVGAGGEFVCASRLDNLASCHAGLCALLDSASRERPSFTRVLVLYDHEEVGSRSSQGAAGSFFRDCLARTVAACEGADAQALPRAMAHSVLVSADMAHAVHPNYADRHEPGHRPVVGRGPVIKTNANQSYASDAETAGLFASLCARAGVAPQHFVCRSDLGCGSTVGPLTAAQAGIRTVDVGNPMLSMHSCREMAGSADVGPMVEVLRLFYAGPA